MPHVFRDEGRNFVKYKINRKIKNHLWMVLKVLIGNEKYEFFRCRHSLGYPPNVKHPKTFNEKMIYKKLHADMDYAVDMADKYKVRSYVENKIGVHVLNKIFYVGTDIHEVDLSDLPNKFVIKTTHGGGDSGNIFVYDKEQMDIGTIDKKIKNNLRKKFGYLTNESWYLDIPPQFIIEEMMLTQKGDIPADYKFFCFDGVCQFVQVNSDRYTDHHRSFYDTQWNLLDFTMGRVASQKTEKPKRFEEMLEVAQTLSYGHDFVRIDLYSIKGGVRFGEFTFIPNAGHEPFVPKEKDDYYGSLINLH